MKYMLFDKAGVFIGRYDSDINSEVPEEAIAVDDDVFFESIQSTDYLYKLKSGLVSKEKVVDTKAVHSKDQVEKLRLVAYSDPLSGCDRYFSESVSLQAEGFAASSAEVKEAKAKGLARKAEIQTLYPWPSE